MLAILAHRVTGRLLYNEVDNVALWAYSIVYGNLNQWVLRIIKKSHP